MEILRSAIRSLRQSPGFALTVMLTLALGIGLNDAIFTVVDSVLLRPLGYRDADRIVSLQSHVAGQAHAVDGIGGDDFNDVARNTRGLEAEAFYASGMDGVRVGRDAVYVGVASISQQFGAVLGVTPVAGRQFDAGAAANSQAMVSAGFARDRFGSMGAALGKPLEIGPKVSLIVGVLPDGFSMPAGTEVWVDAGARPEVASRTAYNQKALGKLRRGASAEALQAELDTVSRRMAATFPEDRGKTIEAVPLQEEVVGRVRPTLRLLMGAVAVILLIAGTNLTHLQIVRGTRRLRVVAIRSALGASRAILLAEALAEGALLALAGGTAAALLAVPSLKLLLRLAPQDMPRLAEVRPNADVFFFSLLVSSFVMLGTAVLPALYAWRVRPAAALRNDGTRGMEARGSRRLRNALLVSEVALTVVLSAGSLLLVRQLIAESQVHLGFEASRLLTLDIHLTETPPGAAASGTAMPSPFATDTPATRRNLTKLEALLRTIRGVPGVRGAEAIDGAPMGFGGTDVSYAIRGRGTFGTGDLRFLPQADVRPVTPGFLPMLGVPLLRGRALAASDRGGTPSVLVINAALARQQFAGQDPIGKQISCGFDEDKSWWTVVGVVGDIHADAPGEPPKPTMYLPLAQHAEKASDPQLVVLTYGDPAQLADSLGKGLHREFPDVALQTSTMTQNIAEVQRLARLRTVLFSAFSAVSLLLAGVGIYAVTSYSVTQRWFEFGLRMAVGASRAQVIALVLRSALVFTVLGTGLGLALAWALTRLLGSMTGALPWFDGVAYAASALGVLLLASSAATIPAARAATAEPMTVLRYE